ncbi:MAG TPA: hypothetical protein VIV60_11155 [Polyangiaceae bacterium]
MPCRFAIRSILSLTLVCSTAIAAGPSDSARGAARRLGTEGLAAYDQGDFDVALDKLERAYAVMKIPSVGLWSARAMVKKGRLVQASERYLEISRIAVEPSDKMQSRAQTDAVRERNELLPRVPQLTILAPGIDVETSEVTLDGERIAPALLGVPSPVNPGEHRLLLKFNGEETWELVSLREAESRQVTLRLPGDPNAAPAPLPDNTFSHLQLDTASSAQHSPQSGQRSQAGHTQRTIGWIAVAVGGAAVAAGAVSGLLAIHRKSELDDSGCRGGHCYGDQSSDLNGYRTMRNVSTVGFIVGGVGIVTGTALVLSAPQQTKTYGSVTGYLGIGSLGLAGSF